MARTEIETVLANWIEQATSPLGQLLRTLFATLGKCLELIVISASFGNGRFTSLVVTVLLPVTTLPIVTVIVF
jgi:hypothetical protein